MAISLVTVASLLAWLAFSQEMDWWLRDPAYKRALLGQFFSAGGASPSRLLPPVSLHGLLLLLAVAAVAAASAMLVPLGPRGSAPGARWPARWLVAFASVVLPPLLLAVAYWPDGGGTLRPIPLLAVQLALLALVGALRLARSRRERNDGEAAADAAPAEGAVENEVDTTPASWGWLCLAPALLLLPIVWWNAVTDIRGFDSLSDHLPRAARIARLARIGEESGELLTPYYPGSFHLLVRWMLALGTDRYAFVPALLGAALCVVAVHALSRRMGQSRAAALASAAAAASCTLTASLATTVQADTMTTAFLLLAVLLAVEWLRRPDGAPLPLWIPASVGAALGLALGTKYSALPPALALSTVIAVRAWRDSLVRDADGEEYRELRPLVLQLGAVLAGALVCGGFWYARNAVEHGNPMFPVAVAGLPGVDVGYIALVKPALRESLLARLVNPWVQWDFSYPFDDGLGAAFPAVAVVGVAVAPFAPGRFAGPRRVVWLVALLSFLLWQMSGSLMTRFGLFPILLAFCFVGDLWRTVPTITVRVATVAAVWVSVGLLAYGLVVDVAYADAVGRSRRRVPPVVDRLPPARIFNASWASDRYALLGRDHRHTVLSVFGPATPDALARSGARYVLLRAEQLPPFAARFELAPLGHSAGVQGGDSLTLWEVRRAR